MNFIIFVGMDPDSAFWSERYKSGQTGWDAGSITPPLKTYFDQLENKLSRILIPGCGHAYEAEYLFEQGFKNVSLIDISPEPLHAFKKRVPSFPAKNLIRGDFFDLKGEWDLIIEQTFFCAINPDRRRDYASKCNELLCPNGKLAGVLFEDALNDDRPPFGGSRKDYIPVFKPYFQFKIFERCYNSIKPRAGRELFILLVKMGQNSRI